MNNFPQKRTVNVAVASKRKHDLSHYHVGTTDWGIMKPVECRYMVPGDEFNYNIFNETRVLNAMPSPTIGRFDVVMRAFFVPIHNVWPAFYDFLKNQPTVYNGDSYSISQAPFITLGTLINGFITDSELCEEISSGTPDFEIYNPSVTPAVTKLYRFKRKGRQINNFLTSLGINIPYGVNAVSDNYNLKLYIILPLVCFWKFYFDWVVPSRFIPEHDDYIQKFISNYLFDPLNFVNGCTYNSFKKYLLKVPLSYYEDDVFTTSTEYPFQSSEPLSDGYSIHNPVQDVDGSAVSDSPLIDGNGAVTDFDGYGIFNMFTLQTLGKLQDLLNRNLIAGSKVQDWLLTEFGIRPNNDALHLSTYLGSKRTGLSVSDVLSNADTLSADGSTGVALGSYAGYVNNRNQFDFSYKAQEHGFYFITHEIVPRTSYFQGLAAQFDLGDRFDFFQPEFDNQQGAPIPFRRLYFSHNGMEDLESQESALARFDSKFGFQLQYADLKFAQDVVSGDFRTRFGQELKSWFLTRDMSYIADSNNQIEGIDEEFCLVKSEYQDWHYIFSDMNDELDPFLVSFYLQAPALRPMKSIAEGFEPTYQNGGKNVTLDFSGAVK